ncbi:S-adenosyl-L-methionine-dependent methyltransferase [Mycena sanguinolenta]|nr:S-adenosyl-L-methionine-dependent methyltransferase [Mycena sanguinolenta]
MSHFDNAIREVTPNVFANNRISSVLDKGKPSKVLFENRNEWLAGTSGLTALEELVADNSLKGLSMLADTMLDPKEGALAFNRAFRTDQSYFEWLHRPENSYQLTRFGLGMRGTAATESTDTLFTGFDWSSLGADSVLVDVGGGIGHISLAIAGKNPALRIVVQDLENQIEQAKIHWKENSPSHVEGGMVEFQVHDFVTPQPVQHAAAFLLRYITHDWPDDRVVTILRHLHDAAQPTTKIMVIDKILLSAARMPDSDKEAIPGAARPSAPAPLLPNWGVGKSELYFYDLTMHCMLGGVERTLEDFVEVFSKGGWKLVRVHHCEGSQMSHMVGVLV